MVKYTTCILATIFSIVGIIGLVSVMYLWETQNPVIKKYSLVFDAGSSHTKLFIYMWDGAKTNGTAVVKQIADFDNSIPGISHFADDPCQVAKSLEPYLEFAKKKIPKEEIKNTPVYMGATAGMRILRQSNQNASNAIFEIIRNLFKKSGFQINNPEYQVRILTGTEEGTFSWITVNYLKGNLGLNEQSSLPYLLEKSTTVGALDMGGASTQITFIPASNYNIPENFSFTLSLYGHVLKVYTHSFLCYGVNEAIRKYHMLLVKESNGTTMNISSPCWLKGGSRNESSDNIFRKPCTYDSAYSNVSTYYHFVGTADHTECQRIVNKLFDFTNCPYKDGCSFNQVYQPSVTNKMFMVFPDISGNGLARLRVDSQQQHAFSVYYYLMKAFNLTDTEDNFSLQTYDNAMYSWCNKTWQDAQLTPGNKKILELLCIEAVYLKTILTKGYGFDNTRWKSLNFNKTVNGCDVGWTMGFMMYTSNGIAAKTGLQLPLMTFSLLIVLFSVFIILAIFLGIFSTMKRTNGKLV